MNITVVGAGYVGCPIALLMAQRHSVTLVDIDAERRETLRSLRSPIPDRDTEAFLEEAREGKRRLELSVSDELGRSCGGADFIIICLPTDWDEKTNRIDCGGVEAALGTIAREAQRLGERPTVVIRSTVPVGFTRSMEERYPELGILYCPEFVRSVQPLRDNLYPFRIVIGCGAENEATRAYSALLRGIVQKEDVEILCLGYEEAEAVKLFSNAYLALRVSFFNEIDSFAELKGLRSDRIIRAVSLDPRIGDYYNNPSFGYGGHCLPKDSKQLLESCGDAPADVVGAIVAANDTRKKHIAAQILKRLDAAAQDRCVGIFRLASRKGTKDLRGAAIYEVMHELRERGVRMIVFEPSLPDGSVYEGCEVVNDLERFGRLSACIAANRWDERLNAFREKVYTRDQFARD